MDTKLIIGIVILIICCMLAFLIPFSPPGEIIIQDDCEGGVCGPPEGYYKRKGGDKMEWFTELAWYLQAAIVAILAFLGYYFLV